MPHTEAAVRAANVEDAADIARLAGDLGYPTAPQEMHIRLANLLADANHYVGVIDGAAGRLSGWIHVEHQRSVEGGEHAELEGLIVDESARGKGLGLALVGSGEVWAAARGLATMTVHSNTVRELSHPFYEAIGFSRKKTQHVYSKALEPDHASLAARANVEQAVPFFLVNDMQASLRFYVDGLGFVMTQRWLYEGTVRWCWLKRGNAGLMLQDFRHDDGRSYPPDGVLGLGVSVMWMTSLRDPDGYRVDFESYTDVPEETVLEDGDRP